MEEAKRNKGQVGQVWRARLYVQFPKFFYAVCDYNVPVSLRSTMYVHIVQIVVYQDIKHRVSDESW